MSQIPMSAKLASTETLGEDESSSSNGSGGNVTNNNQPVDPPTAQPGGYGGSTASLSHPPDPLRGKVMNQVNPEEQNPDRALDNSVIPGNLMREDSCNPGDVLATSPPNRSTTPAQQCASRDKDNNVIINDKNNASNCPPQPSPAALDQRKTSTVSEPNKSIMNMADEPANSPLCRGGSNNRHISGDKMKDRSMFQRSSSTDHCIKKPLHNTCSVDNNYLQQQQHHPSHRRQQSYDYMLSRPSTRYQNVANYSVSGAYFTHQPLTKSDPQFTEDIFDSASPPRYSAVEVVNAEVRVLGGHHPEASMVGPPSPPDEDISDNKRCNFVSHLNMPLVKM